MALNNEGDIRGSKPGIPQNFNINNLTGVPETKIVNAKAYLQVASTKSGLNV